MSVSNLLNIVRQYEIIFGIAFIFLSLFSVGVNFSPSDSYNPYAAILWLSVGTGWAILIIRNPANMSKRWSAFPVWRKFIGFVVTACLFCFFARFLILFGIPYLITNAIGEPFQDQRVITKKSSLRQFCFHIVHVDGYHTPLKGICVDDFLNWNDSTVMHNQAKVGQKALLSGSKTALGTSVNSLTLVTDVSPKDE